MSLRLRLALLFSLVLIIALAAFGLGVQVAVQRMSHESMVREMETQAQELIAANPLQMTDVRAGPRTITEDTSLALARLQTFKPGCPIEDVEDLIEQRAISGTTLPLSEAGMIAVQEGRPWLETLNILNNPHLIYSKPVVDNNQLVGVAQVARPLSEQARMLVTLRDGLVFGGGAASVLVFGLMWLLAGQALHPIKRLATEAQSIATHKDFSRRLDPPISDDELGRMVTALNSMLVELNVAYRQTETHLETQRDFVADVSHELRAPLTTVRGNLALLQRDPPMDEAERHAVLRDAVDEIERMTRLVNELLLLARTNSSQPMRLLTVDAVALAANTRRKAAAMARGRPIALQTTTDEIFAHANPDALSQVLLILLDNAAKFTPAHGRIWLSVDADASRIYISVNDTGIGIHAEAQSRIFERFYRADHAQPGSGLGLYIARELVRAQAGELTVCSTPGRGSCFTISLPLA
jgi:signal transduction histidine kinase